MRVVIIEDEAPAAKRLERLIRQLPGGIEVVQVLDSVEASVRYLGGSYLGGSYLGGSYLGGAHLGGARGLDLIFMDIQLADGLSFSIFDQVTLDVPVIFTTAFDQYTLKAFKVNSVDYLLKPIDEAELARAVEKYRQFHGAPKSPVPPKERLLIRLGKHLQYLKTEATAYYYAEGKVCFAVDFQENTYILDQHLNELEEQLSPQRFFRINRQLLVNVEAVKKIHNYFGGRLKLELKPASKAEAVVSREKVTRFKDWLNA